MVAGGLEGVDELVKTKAGVFSLGLRLATEECDMSAVLEVPGVLD